MVLMIVKTHGNQPRKHLAMVALANRAQLNADEYIMISPWWCISMEALLFLVASRWPYLRAPAIRQL